MKEKIQLIHPRGKKAIKMDQAKYQLLKQYLLDCLQSGNEVTHSQLYKLILIEFKSNGVKFQGSVEWHLEWVKLDLEARNLIKRIGTTSPYKYSI